MNCRKITCLRESQFNDNDIALYEQKHQYLLWSELCEWSFLWFEYSVELLVEYLSTRLISEVAIDYRVAQNKLMITWFLIQGCNTTSQNNAKMLRI